MKMPVIVYNMQENVCSPVCTQINSISYRQNIIRVLNAGNVHNCTYMHDHEHAAYSTVALRYTHSRLEATAIPYVNSTP